MPPALPYDVDPAAAPLSAASAVHVLSTGVLNANAAAECGAAADAAFAVLVTDPIALLADAGAELHGIVGLGLRPVLVAEYERIAEIAAVRPFVTIAQGDTTIRVDDTSGIAELDSSSDPTEPVPQILLVGGNLTIAAGSALSGLIIARGALMIEAGASVQGAVHAVGTATIAGAVLLDTCAVSDAVRASGLDRPWPAGPRAWLPF
jgi:hypothetical protein